ncbi:hypothetical protein [Candidatus Protofrankia californiensis]|uniref:hypothetical protein n=1 Tax=Candidatus Protofrankia californiensis TaxID=1839754 RepID=UPI0010411894|nr:hypothetical protein [Candidatus Protofrankia californiensis]
MPSHRKICSEDRSSRVNATVPSGRADGRDDTTLLQGAEGVDGGGTAIQHGQFGDGVVCARRRRMVAHPVGED